MHGCCCRTCKSVQECKRIAEFKRKVAEKDDDDERRTTSSESAVNGPVGLSDMTRIAGGEEWIAGFGLSVSERGFRDEEAGKRQKRAGKRESGGENVAVHDVDVSHCFHWQFILSFTSRLLFSLLSSAAIRLLLRRLD